MKDLPLAKDSKTLTISRKQLYRKDWTALIAPLDFASTAPLPRAVSAVLNDISKEDTKNVDTTIE